MEVVMRDELSDRLAVQDLINRYSDAVSRGDFDFVATLFTDNAVWKCGPPFNLHFEGEAIASSLMAAVAAFDMLVQTSAGSVIDLDGDRAKARTMLFEMGRASADGPGFIQYGIYDDVIERAGDRWQFVSRYFHCYYRDDALTGAFFPLHLEP
jgi:ketosteroid isomerase-like protein